MYQVTPPLLLFRKVLYIRNFQILGHFFDCTGQFVSDLVGNPNSWFSHAKAQLISILFALLFLMHYSYLLLQKMSHDIKEKHINTAHDSRHAENDAEEIARVL